MLFNSLEFLVFFPVVVALYFALPQGWRQIHLLVASYLFYMAWEPAYALLLLASTVVDWGVALGMERVGKPGRRALLGLSLAVNLGLLGSFKYYNLINSTFTALVARWGVDWPLPESNLLLPVGISFYTFQTLAYTIDVYRGKQAAERNFFLFALYVSYFPQLVAGPIERSGRLLPQLEVMHAFDPERVASGLRLMLWGFFKKVVVADRLAVVVQHVYDQPSEVGGAAFVLGTLCFGYQVYCDFSGYSDIAIGAARVMGIELMKNFDQPHLARSTAEFWSRWHISLITWFRDYVYIPLGGSRRGPARTALNVLIVFGISGLWHGADWSFLLWGLLSGLAVLGGRVTAAHRSALAERIGLVRLPRLRVVLQIAGTILFTYGFFPLFRADDIQHAAAMYARLPVGWGELFDAGGQAFLHQVGVSGALLVYTVALIPVTEVLEYVQRHKHTFAPAPLWLRWAGDYALLGAVLFLGRFGLDQFVYFQF